MAGALRRLSFPWVMGWREPLYRLKGNMYTICEDRRRDLRVGSDAGLDLIDLQTGLSFARVWFGNGIGIIIFV